jgi:sulfatase maturation enzyme AslB (radical SAM superfamily)
MRARGVDVPTRRLRITNLSGSEEEEDLSEPPNCGGFGRIRHFRTETSAGWPPNPLPVVPAARALGLEVPAVLEAQVFQNAVCNWRCWYCFVDFELLSGREDRSSMLTAERIVEFYLAEERRPP